jgi:hypothetical protein
VSEDVKESAKDQTKEREERPLQIISDVLGGWFTDAHTTQHK